MLISYIQTAMQRATYKMHEDGTFLGEIPPCDGVWAHAATLEACRNELQSVLEGWIVLGLRVGDKLPILDGVDLAPPLVRRKGIYC